MPKLSIGVIGAGSIGDVHLTGYAADPKNVSIQAICDKNPSRLAEMGEKFGVPAEHRYQDYRKMLNREKMDAVSVCLPNAFHFDAASEAIRHGCHVLVEKPMVLTLQEARTLQKLHAKNQVKFMVAFSHRFMAANIAARKLIARNVIGKPFMIRVRFAHSGPYPGWAQSDWFYKRKYAGGGALLDMGIHAIDICQYFMGPIKSVAAEVRTLRKNIEVDDNAVMLLDFGGDKKALGYIECGWTSGPGFAGIEIYGDKGTLLLELFKQGRVIRGVTNPDGTYEVKDELIPVNEEKTHWPLQMESWIKHLQGKKTVTEIPGMAEGISSLAIAIAATESSKTGKRVKIRS